ncbi:MAG: 3-dehydroquinate synthase [Armatimonadetes bacterium]|nr:3-dehydroquinate synthase [Armatimonadota bacterium]
MRIIALVGLMGSGKSQVGQALARRLGWTFADTDAEIEARDGRSIPAIFRESGEADFRAVERAVVRGITKRRRMVVATGGGAVLSAASRRLLYEAGPVFYLRVPVEVLAGRLGADPGRPLLGDDSYAALERLSAERETLYADRTIPVDAAAPVDRIVDEILGYLADARRRVRVDLGPRTYEVRVGIGALALLGVDLHGLGARGRVAVVTHRALARRFGEDVTAALEAAGFAPHVMAVPMGERAKSLQQAGRLYDALAEAGLARIDTVAALGGGVVGDLAGFVAGTYMRGVRLVHLPTTLLAQIDSSIGGKAAVNHPRAKNLIGVFHQPALVVADVETLRSLPPRERQAGLAEAVKYAMVLDAELFGVLEGQENAAARRWSAQQAEEIVFRCASLKARVVETDEFEEGPREVLNYGHTVGHAIEAALAGRYVHGEAVAIGIRVEGQVAVRLGLLASEEARRQDALLARLGLPVSLPPGPAGPLLDAMRLDKKRRDGRIRCTLPEGIGRARLGVEVSETLLGEVIHACQESS